MVLIRIALREVAANKARMLLAVVAVALGSAFVAGTLVFRDTVRASADASYSATAADVTVVPRAGAGDRQAGTGLPATLDRRVRDEAARAPGALTAVGRVTVPDVTVVYGRDGATDSAAVTAADWPSAPDSAMRLAEGRPPAGKAEVVVDRRLAREGGVRVGDRVRVLAVPGAFDATVAGIAEPRTARARDADVYLDAAAARHRLLGVDGVFTSVEVTARPGVDDARLKAEVRRALADPAHHTVHTRAEQAAERGKTVTATADLVSYLMFGFAGISLVVGVFLIGNTFSMLVAARTRRSGLLRALGARRGQVNRMLLAEAAVAGAAGATVGLGLGVGLAAVLTSLGGTFADGVEAGGGPVVRWTTPVAGYAVGILTTLAAAWSPARRAGRVPPMAALSRAAVPPAARSLRRRSRLAAVAGLAGVSALVLAALGDDSGRAVPLFGAGVLLTLAGLIAGAPAIGVCAVRLLGRFGSRRPGPAVRLARGNAVRDPRRTGATAAALMIGIALVGFLSVLASSLVASVDGQLDRTVRADYFVMSDRPMTGAVAQALRDTPGLARVTPQKTVRADLITGHGTAADQELTATTAGFPEDFALTFASGDAGTTFARDGGTGSALETGRGGGRPGSAAGPAPDGITVPEAFAEKHRLKVGDPVQVRFHGGTTAGLVVGGITRDGDLFSSGATYIDVAVARAHLTQARLPLDDVYFATADPGADRAGVSRALTRALEPFPHVKVRDQESYKQALHDSVGATLYLVYALLALAIGIAVLGVVNTLALSVVERTREIGLLRAVGMNRRQIHRMIRTESVVIAVAGAVPGLIAGLVWGAVCRRVLADRGLDTLAVPWPAIATMLAGSVLVGVLAAWLPARRAARLDVLRAVAAHG